MIKLYILKHQLSIDFFKYFVKIFRTRFQASGSDLHCAKALVRREADP